MSARNGKIGMSHSAKNRNASLLEHALRTSLEKSYHKPSRRRSPEEIHAQLILIIGTTLAMVFLIVTIGIKEFLKTWRNLTILGLTPLP